MCSSDIFLGLIAILFPPLSVWVKRGICSADSLINILLCTLGFIPGLLHAWYIIAKYPEPDLTYEPLAQDIEGGGQITYVIVQTPNGGLRRVKTGGGNAGNVGRGQSGYGTNAPMEAPVVRQEVDGRWSAGEGSSTQGVGHGQVAEGAGEAAGEGASHLPPPTYADAVKGDHKVQTRD